ncbi:MAG: conjugal transfer protein TrbB [Bradyrhizobium sp.]|nr:conjugal transfer protein TrbB [Bradyrhizobium sp.]
MQPDDRRQILCIELPADSAFFNAILRWRQIAVARVAIDVLLLIPVAGLSGRQPGIVMAVHPFRSDANNRGARMLRTALGASIAAWLEDPAVIEVMLNPDGRLWVDRLGQGISDSGELLPPADGERIVRLVAHHVGVEVHCRSPRVSAELPETGERFEGLLPPVVSAPAFAIRKPAVAIFSLDDYVRAGIMSDGAAGALRVGVASRANILVAGGTGTGKTTLTNALLAEIAQTGDRVVLIEDTRELQCTAPNMVAMRTKDGVASLSDLVRSSLRLRPDRIPIGEVRGAEALDLLKAWGTGHPGGVGTIHAGTAIGALRRLEQLIQEAVVTVPRALIADTINLIAVLVRDGHGRRLSELARVEGLGLDGDYRVIPITNTPDGVEA